MKRNAALAILALIVSACATTPPTAVHQPMSVRPAPAAVPLQTNGAIYHASQVRPLFEDRRARLVGDTLVINIVEKTQATKKSNTSTEKTQTLEASVPLIKGIPGKTFQGLGIEAETENKFGGKGESNANNTFSGTITCTVVDVLPNGNLLVSGEKVVAINQGDEFIRFSGVVNPMHITAANTVNSIQVADARIEYRANGTIDSAQVMGWLARFFLTFMPL